MESSSRYGPVLDKYLDMGGLQLRNLKSISHPSPIARSPSREEIRQAILQLSDPEKVTYLTFETILSLENTEACSDLELLLSHSAKDSLPACFRLASAYCQGSRLMFDHAYGFLCVKVIALLVQVAMLSRSGYIDRLIELLTLGHAEQSIFAAFTTTVYSLMVDAMDDHLDSGPSARHERFGWDHGSIGGAKPCLPEIGGCTTGEIQILLSQLWNSRAGFLVCGSRGREALFPGFGGFLCWIWCGVAQQYGFPGQNQNSASAWTQLVDLSTRFTLYSSDREADLMSFVLLGCPEYARIAPILDKSSSAVDAQDRTRIAIMTPKKIRSGEDLPLRFVTTLFCFACPSVDYQENIFDIFSAKIDRMWFEFDRLAIRTEERLQAVANDLPFFCQGFLHVLKVIQYRDPELFFRLLSGIGEDLYEGIGRVILLPLSSKTLKAGKSSDNLKLLLDNTSYYVSSALGVTQDVIAVEDANKRTGCYPGTLISFSVRHVLL
ncbi:unnamed protein product [Rhizoctonia solani]|uniref:Uncharacterized protein n=1 Tax=Rhizoctonia solani TaxID=456999 RepID=A0A8H3HQQ9_9AGAM|nr:unnamed protein product [Rhizoctonia solani]